MFCWTSGMCARQTYKQGFYEKGMDKEWHIWDFPGHIRLHLTESVRKAFFENMYFKFGTQKAYAQFLNVDVSTISSYYSGRSSIPVNLFLKSMSFIDEELKNKIQTGILMYSSILSFPILNPKLPLKESPEIYRILGHLIGDGSASENHTPYYCNNNEFLRDQFKRDLQIFGEVKTNDRTFNPTPGVCFPVTLSDILAHIFQVQFTNPDRLPPQVFFTSIENKKLLLQSLYDDECTTSVHLIISFKNKNLLEDTRKLVNSFGIETGSIIFKKDKLKSKPTWAFRIKNKELVKFQKLIGLSHPLQKQKLKTLIDIKNNSKNKFISTRDLEFKILDLTKEGKKTIELQYALQIHYPRIYNILVKLESENLVKREGYKNNILWFSSKV